jgi:hypothetical protein
VSGTESYKKHPDISSKNFQMLLGHFRQVKREGVPDGKFGMLKQFRKTVPNLPFGTVFLKFSPDAMDLGDCIVFKIIGSGSNPLKKTPLPPGEGNIRINGFDPPPIIVLGSPGVNAVNPGILNLPGFVPHPNLRNASNLLF